MEKEKTKKIIFIVSLLILLIGIVWSDLFTENAFCFLEKVSKIGFANLAVIGVLKGILALMSSMKIGVGIEMNVGAILKGLTDVVDKAFNFFLISNGLIILQLFLLKISKFLLLKILIVILSGLIFIKQIKKITMPILMILLLINPGFSFYVLATKIIYEHTVPDTGNLIKERIENTKNSFERIIEIEGFFNKVKNAPKIIFNIMSESLTNLIDVVLVYFVSSLVLFLIFPGFFYYFMYLLIKKLLMAFGEFI